MSPHQKFWADRLDAIKAFVDGRSIQYRFNDSDLWSDIWLDGSPRFDHGSTLWRIKPTLKRVPLGPDDFTAGACWLRLGPTEDGYTSSLITQLSQIGVFWPNQQLFRFDYLVKQEHARYRINGGPWLPCYKEVES